MTPKKKREQLPVELLIEKWKQCLRVLQALTPHQRRHHFDMGFWIERNTCGTVGCAAGHCGIDPWFKRHGLKITFYKTKRGEWRDDQSKFHPMSFFSDPAVEDGEYRARSTFVPAYYLGDDVYDKADNIKHSAVVKRVRQNIRELKALAKASKNSLTR